MGVSTLPSDWRAGGTDLPFLVYCCVLKPTSKFPTLPACRPCSLISFPGVCTVATAPSYTWHTLVTPSAGSTGDTDFSPVTLSYPSPVNFCLSNQNGIILASVFPQTFSNSIRALITPSCSDLGKSPQRR